MSTANPLFDDYPPTWQIPNGIVIESRFLDPTLCGAPGYGTTDFPPHFVYVVKLALAILTAALIWNGLWYWAGATVIIMLPFLIYQLRRDHIIRKHSRTMRFTFLGKELMIDDGRSHSYSFHLGHHPSRFEGRQHSGAEIEFNVGKQRARRDRDNDSKYIYQNSYEIVLNYGEKEYVIANVAGKSFAEPLFQRLNVVKQLLDEGNLPLETGTIPKSVYEEEPERLKQRQARYEQERQEAKARGLNPLVLRSLELLDLSMHVTCPAVEMRYLYLMDQLHPSRGGSIYLREELVKARRILRLWLQCPLDDDDDDDDDEDDEDEDLAAGEGI